MIDASPAMLIVRRLAVLGPAGHRALDLALKQMTPLEMAALNFTWGEFWARPKQLAPTHEWESFGLMTGRGFGKTRSFAEHVTEEMRQGRAMRVGACGMTEKDTIRVIVEGEGGLLACAPPWYPAEYLPSKGEVVYPINGAKVSLYSAQDPDHFRGPEHHLFWGDEVAAWPKNTWADCLYNIRMGLRLGYARFIWSTTPRRVPFVKLLLDRAKEDPLRHVIVRGSTHENRGNLPDAFFRAITNDYGGTRVGRQEIDGEYLDDAEGAIVKQSWIDAKRAHAPMSYVRRVIAVDPAISARRGSDRTGVVIAGLGTDAQYYVIADLSGKYSPQQWARVVVDSFRAYGCSHVIAEQNRGGDLVKANLLALDPTLEKRVLEVHARRGKATRAEPIAALYERGKISHVIGADLATLEEQLTTWDPTATDSPDALDALVHALWELASLSKGQPSGAYETVTGASRMTRSPAVRRDANGDEWEDDDE